MLDAIEEAPGMGLSSWERTALWVEDALCVDVFCERLSDVSFSCG
jgi:hypothetical protein